MPHRKSSLSSNPGEDPLGKELAAARRDLPQLGVSSALYLGDEAPALPGDGREHAPVGVERRSPTNSMLIEMELLTDTPPAEFEARYSPQQGVPATEAALN